jgi:hypothetical protein
MDDGDRRSVGALSTAFPRSRSFRKRREAQLMAVIFDRSSTEMEIALPTVTRVK